MRLIDADALIQDLRSYADNKGPVCGEYELANGILKAVGRVEQAPTIKAVIQAQWAFDDFDGDGLDYQCSSCGGYSRLDHSYCPRCGAQMITPKGVSK